MNGHRLCHSLGSSSQAWINGFMLISLFCYCLSTKKGNDINRIEGVYPVRPPLPAVGGYEGAGVVHSVGSAIQALSPGDLVMVSPPSPGTWQTHVVKDKSLWHKLHKDTPVEYAATVTINLRKIATVINIWRMRLRMQLQMQLKQQVRGLQLPPSPPGWL